MANLANLLQPFPEVLAPSGHGALVSKARWVERSGRWSEGGAEGNLPK